MARMKNSPYLKKNEMNHGFVVLVGDQTATATCSSNGRKRKTISKAQQIRPWSDLPADIIGELLAGLSSTDQIRFGASCRNFLSSISKDNSSHGNGDHNQVFDRLPWLVKYYSYGYIRCELYGPVRHRIPYAIYTITNKEVEISKYRTRLLACKHDWMFFTWPDQKQNKNAMNDRINRKTSFVLFSPFTKQIVTLPDLDRTSMFCTFGIKDRHDIGTFSSHPSSPDCVYFVLNGNYQKVIISTCSLGDRDWAIQVFDKGLSSLFFSAVYYEGSFYIVYKHGNLSAYDVAQRDWKYIISSKPFFLKGVQVQNLLLHDGQLLLKCEDRSRAKKDECNVILFSRSTSSWIKQTSLGDYALFLGSTSVFPDSADTSCSSRMRDMADKIFYYKHAGGEQKCQCYSLKDGKVLDQSIYSCLPDIFPAEFGIWIEPPYCMPARASSH